MKISKILSLLALLATASFFLISCEETTDDPISGSPSISSINPSIASVGETITITGSNFGTADDEGTVVFSDNVQATGVVGAANSDYVSWTNTMIEVRVPAGAVSGPVFVRNGNVASNQIDIQVVSPLAGPTDLQATSVNATTLHLTWTSSTDEGNADFSGYQLNWSANGEAQTPVQIDPAAATNPLPIENLTEGVEYTFTMYTIDNDGYLSVDPTTVTWSPASRYDESVFGGSTINVYETTSDFGSGLDLYDPAQDGTMSKAVSSSADANLALDTRNGIEFGSASQINYSYGGGTPNSAEIGEVVEVSELNNEFNVIPLDQDNYDEKVLDLNDYNGSIVMNVRVFDTNTNQYNYGRVLIRNNGGWLEGSGDDEYIVVEVSYQKEAGVPYAKTAKK